MRSRGIPEKTKPRVSGAFGSKAKTRRLPGSRLLRHDLLSRRLGGCGLLGDRRAGAAGGLGGHVRAGIAVARVVALAFGGLAVALAHRGVLLRSVDPRAGAERRAF